MIRQCENCDVRTRRRKFCSDRCASIDRQRRYDRQQANGPMIELTAMHMSVRSEAPETVQPLGPRAFGVPTTDDVAFVFNDDKTRFKHMGISEFRI